MSHIPPEKKHVFLDTNALMAIAELKIDVFSALERLLDVPYQLCVLSGTLEELGKIQKEQRQKYALAAKLALSLLRVKKVSVINQQGYVDALLVQHSRRGDLILTQDKDLKKELSKPYLTLQTGKKKVVMVK